MKLIARPTRVGCAEVISDHCAERYTSKERQVLYSTVLYLRPVNYSWSGQVKSVMRNYRLCR
jgi:hypothetical protein